MTQLVPRSSRRSRLFALFSPLLALAPLLPTRAHAGSEARVTEVEAVELVVHDLAQSRAFFELLGFEAEGQATLSGPNVEQSLGVPGARIERLELSLGRERVALLEYLAPNNGRPLPPDTHGNDRWFQHLALVVSDMARAYAWLHAHHVQHVSSTPQKLPAWNPAAGGIEAFYFRDPDGHALELIHFPKGKGDARWQAKPRCSPAEGERCLFLGIDHTALTVADTEQSLRFYRDALGLRVAGEAENYGPEQEHLNGVFGAHLRITALRAARGPGIELLEYLAPAGGRPTPPDVRPNDLAHFQVVVRAPSASAVWNAVVPAGGSAVASDMATRRALVRDRDGHAVFVHE
jgi:catechol 2,3-dioxygenase-like lactoylglutathione lyase family enzyme